MTIDSASSSSIDPGPPPPPPYDEVTLEAVVAGIYDNAHTRSLEAPSAPRGFLLLQLANTRVTAARARDAADYHRSEITAADDARAAAEQSALELTRAIRALDAAAAAVPEPEPEPEAAPAPPDDEPLTYADHLTRPAQ